MEAMLTTSQQELPLPPAMTAKLDAGATSGATLEYAVLESEVWLEIENLKGRRIAVQRTIKGGRDKNLITVHDGPALTEPGTYQTTDYFVNRAGGATRSVGFHRFLANFLEWDLPAVQTYEGNETPLYLQCIFPFFMTEQTRGWSSIQPPVPTQFRIRDVHKRAVEFLLGMDAHKNALTRQELQLRKTRLEARWSAQIRQLKEIATTAGGVAQALPSEPTSVWPPQVSPTINVPEQKHWINLEERIKQREKKKQALEAQNVPQVSNAAESVKHELMEAESNVINQQATLARLIDALSAEEQEVARVQDRLAVIKEDIQRNKDARTLRSLGSRQGSELDNGTCPVCHQHVADSLVPLAPGQTVMSLDESISFLSEQSRTFEGILQQSKRVVAARQLQIQAARVEISQLRDRVRYLRQTLISDDKSPSIAAVYERVELERDLKQDIRYSESFANTLTEFADLSRDWKDLQIALENLPKDDLSADDRQKLTLWGSSVRQQLREYGFGSISASEIELSPFTYKPELEGFELQTTISASDLIRTIWAYQSGMLEVAREASTNHPGMLVFDEPRQQSTRDVSFAALLARASNASKHGQQVVFFTSEEKVRLKEHLSNLNHSLHEINGRVIKKRLNGNL
ncbi:hypothetical protein [Melaminivora jejuensis]